MQAAAIKQGLDLLQDAPTMIGAGRAANGDVVCFCTLGPGVEAQIATPGGQVKHRCFHSIYAFMVWYAETYVETGRV